MEVPPDLPIESLPSDKAEVYQRDATITPRRTKLRHGLLEAQTEEMLILFIRGQMSQGFVYRAKKGRVKRKLVKRP